MRNLGTAIGLALLTLAGPARAQDESTTGEASTPPPATSPASLPAPAGRLTLGVDGAVQVPLSSSLKDATGVGFGGLLRGEWSLLPTLNATLRAGYFYSLNRHVSDSFQDVNYTVRNIPIWLGGKYFVTDMVYAALEVGYNRLTSTLRGTMAGQPQSYTHKDNKYGGTIGAGLLLGPVDVKLQLAVLDLGHSGDSIALLFGAGYNFLRLF